MAFFFLIIISFLTLFLFFFFLFCVVTTEQEIRFRPCIDLLFCIVCVNSFSSETLQTLGLNTMYFFALIISCHRLNFSPPFFKSLIFLILSFVYIDVYHHSFSFQYSTRYRNCRFSLSAFGEWPVQFSVFGVNRFLPYKVLKLMYCPSYWHNLQLWRRMKTFFYSRRMSFSTTNKEILFLSKCHIFSLTILYI